MGNLHLSEFIEDLQLIYEEYGDLPVKGNIICGERGTLSSMCIINDDHYEEREKTLLIETLPESFGCSGLFSAYEYPSMKNISLIPLNKQQNICYNAKQVRDDK